MKKGLGLQANISDFNTTLPQTKHLNFFMGTNPVRYANGGAVRKGVPSSNMNVTQGFLPMALGFDNGGDVSFFDVITKMLGNYLAKQSGKSPDDPEIKEAAENLQRTNPDAVRIIIESEYGSGVSAGAYDSGFPIGGEPKLPTETVTDIGEMRIPEDFGRKPLPSNINIGEMRIPENFPQEPGLIDKAKQVGGGIVDTVVDLGTSIADQFKTDDTQKPLTKEQIGSQLDELLKQNEAKNQPKKEEKKEEKKTITAEPDETDKPVDSGISSLQGQTKKGGGPKLTKEQQEDLQKTLKSSTGNEGKKDVPSWALPLMSAGFAMMASKSPYFLQALGEAGQEGIKTLTAQKQAEQDRLDAQADRDLAKAQAAYYKGEGRQTSSTPMIIGGKYFVRKGENLVPLMIGENQATATISRQDAIEILQKDPLFLELDRNKQEETIEKFMNLYNNTNLLQNTKIQESEKGGFNLLDAVSSLPNLAMNILEQF
jgi:hypothetical protein